MEELEASAEKQYLDDDVEVRAHETYKVEDVAEDAGATAPQQMQTEEKSMNSFVSSKTEVFEKIGESLRQCKGVEDLNDDEIMELFILSNELNACENTAILIEVRVACSEVGNPSKVRSGFDQNMCASLQVADGDAEALHPRTSTEFDVLGNVQGSIVCQRPESVPYYWSDLSLEHEGSKIKQHEETDEMAHKFQGEFLMFYVEMDDGTSA